jgi:uncharacterized protein
MADFLVAIGLFFAIEGVLFAAFPLRAKCAIATALDMPDVRLRIVGLVSALAGVVIAWLVTALKVGATKLVRILGRFSAPIRLLIAPRASY